MSKLVTFLKIFKVIFSRVVDTGKKPLQENPNIPKKS
jgi:hypothetical protein